MERMGEKKKEEEGGVKKFKKFWWMIVMCIELNVEMNVLGEFFNEVNKGVNEVEMSWGLGFVLLNINFC